MQLINNLKRKKEAINKCYFNQPVKRYSRLLKTSNNLENKKD